MGLILEGSAQFNCHRLPTILNGRLYAFALTPSQGRTLKGLRQLAENFARSGARKAISVTEAKAKVLEMIQKGFKLEEAMAVVGRSVETYYDWRKNDEEFKRAVDTIRFARGKTGKKRMPVPDFPEFCRDWLHQPLFPHQLKMLDVIEGREPADLHDSMGYEAGYPNRVLINVPPEHAKSTTFTVNYIVWRIHKDPDIRVVLISKGTALAENFLYEIKQKLTSPIYREMHIAFGPRDDAGEPIGWQDPDNSWTNNRIYVMGKNATPGQSVQRDPTVQAMGIKGQIYGRRADIIILDDIIDADNAREVETQLRKINRDISSRLPSEQEGGGLMAVLGTRVAPMDIYRILNDLEDADGRKVYTYLRMPAVLDYGNGDSDTWQTLWPEKWSGPSLSRRRVDAGWNLYYQQLDVDDEMTFKAEAVNASINGARFPGLLTPDGMVHRPGGMNGLYVVCGMDPAASGNTAIIVTALDRETEKRYVLDGWNKTNATAQDIINQFKKFTDKYRPHEWVIEKNGVQRFIAQLPELVDYSRSRGAKIRQHHTTDNKFDEDWGVSTMGPLFDSCVEWDEDRKRWRPTGKGLIELPSPRQNQWVNDLIQQLTIWQPQGMAQKQKTDLVMALWFTHIAFADQLVRRRNIPTHMHSPFTTPAARKRQQVINLAELREARRLENAG